MQTLLPQARPPWARSSWRQRPAAPGRVRGGRAGGGQHGSPANRYRHREGNRPLCLPLCLHVTVSASHCVCMSLCQSLCQCATWLCLYATICVPLFVYHYLCATIWVPLPACHYLSATTCVPGAWLPVLPAWREAGPGGRGGLCLPPHTHLLQGSAAAEGKHSLIEHSNKHIDLWAKCLSVLK